MSEVADRYRKLISRGEGTDRIAFFSDAVFAIALTLLVLDIRLPPGTEADDLLPALLALWPSYFALVLTFAILGISWISHHRKFRFIVRFDTGLIWINLLFLMFVALTPLPTSVIAEFAPALPAVVLYAANVAALGLLQLALWAYAKRRGLMSDAVDPELYRYFFRANAVAPSVFLVSIAIAFLNPTIAMLSWILIAPVGAVMERLAGRRRKAG